MRPPTTHQAAALAVLLKAPATTLGLGEAVFRGSTAGSGSVVRNRVLGCGRAVYLGLARRGWAKRAVVEGIWIHSITLAGRAALKIEPVPDYRRKNGEKAPRREVVNKVVEDVAADLRICSALVTGTSCLPAALVARRRAWKTIMELERCSVSGLATVWGCDRQSIHRGLLKAG